MKHSDIFDPEANQESFQYWMRSKGPDRCYSILFTARSGSSWLTNVLTQTRQMGTPGEWFNPSLMPESSRTKGARNLDQFVDVISRHQIHGGLFGFEITYHQLIAVFGSEEVFQSYFPDLQYFWLVRRDIVSQAVSLLKMEQTRVSHAPNNSPEEIAKSDQQFTYNAEMIKRWIHHTLLAERGSEALFDQLRVKPTRISYEGIIEMGERATAEYFAKRLKVQTPIAAELSSSYKKIGTVKNDEFAQRFRAENSDYMNAIDAEREPRLRLHTLSE